MPSNDGTGPEGDGPKTGRGLGDCSGSIIENEEHLSRMGFSQNRFLAEEEISNGSRIFFEDEITIRIT